jgi:hypothetical protein
MRAMRLTAHRHEPWTTRTALPTARAFAHMPTAFDHQVIKDSAEHFVLFAGARIAAPDDGDHR